MLICTGCGEIMPEDDLRKIREESGEYVYGCPSCGDTCIEARQCHCGDWHDPEDLLPGGYCETCLMDAITQELAEDFITDREEWETFYIDFWLNGRAYLLDLLSKFFHSKPEEEQLDKLREYIYATKYGPAEFAEWLQDRREANAE